MKIIFFIFAFITACIADCYMHEPRGCNNRLNEKSANRNNANRLFDSQNNNRGGYNVGDMDDTNGFSANNGDGWNDNNRDEKMYNYERDDSNNNRQYEEPFVEGSVLRTTHTVQHGCGNDKNKCNIILGWTCDSMDAFEDDPFDQAGYQADGLRIQLRNGLNTGTSADPNTIANVENTRQTNLDNNRGIHESEEYYAIAKARKRNEGLFTADQKLNGNSQIHTRQNPGGTRRGLEVPEERDYFPWWYPSPWRAAVIWHNNVTECELEMANKADATGGEAKTQCYPSTAAFNAGNQGNLQNIVRRDNQADCEDTSRPANQRGVWQVHQYNVAKPLCKKAEWSQVNNLGNVENTEDGGLPRYHDWTLPTIAELRNAGCHIYDVTAGGLTFQKARMVVRLRYNMSTTDYDPLRTDAHCNQDNNERIQSPVQQNPTVDVGFKMQGLRLALNTAQTGRTFQDRSHVMAIVSKPANAHQNKKLYNVNVQGKRGNIVQTFPAVEYDFWPRKLVMKVGECVAFGWTGSNTHNNGNPGGDGQTGDAGEGRGGTDRSNLIQLLDKRESYPVPLDKNTNDFFEHSKCFRTLGGADVTSGDSAGSLTAKNAQLYLLSGGYYRNFGEIETKDEMNVLLDNVSATMRPLTCCPEKVGDFVFVSTRNNNFSNRDQKLEIIVGAA